MNRARLEEQAVELWITYILRWGVMLSMVLVLAGTVLEFARAPAPFSVQVAFAHSVRGVLAGARAGQSRAFISLGLLALIATPLVRVALFLALFLHLRDRVYSAICFFLLAMLALGLVLGK